MNRKFYVLPILCSLAISCGEQDPGSSEPSEAKSEEQHQNASTPRKASIVDCSDLRNASSVEIYERARKVIGNNSDGGALRLRITAPPFEANARFGGSESKTQTATVELNATKGGWEYAGVIYPYEDSYNSLLAALIANANQHTSVKPPVLVMRPGTTLSAGKFIMIMSGFSKLLPQYSIVLGAPSPNSKLPTKAGEGL